MFWNRRATQQEEDSAYETMKYDKNPPWQVRFRRDEEIRTEIERIAKLQEQLKKMKQVKTGYKHKPVFKKLKLLHLYKKIKMKKILYSSTLKDYNKFENALYNKSVICAIHGERGGGKSVLAFKLAENMRAKTNKPVYAVNFPNKNLPNWITHIEDIQEVPKGSLVIWDEAGIDLNQRSTFNTKTRVVGNLLKIARHEDLSLIFISQNSRNLQKDIVQFIDIKFLLPDNLNQIAHERPETATLYRQIRLSKKPFKKEYGEVIETHKNFIGMLHIPLPSFWNEEVSKSYAKE